MGWPISAALLSAAAITRRASSSVIMRYSPCDQLFLPHRSITPFRTVSNSVPMKIKVVRAIKEVAPYNRIAAADPVGLSPESSLSPAQGSPLRRANRAKSYDYVAESG